MKKIAAIATATILLYACNNTPATTSSAEAAAPKQDSVPITGTWKLLTGTLVDKIKGDTTVTDHTKGESFIKIINGDHFAFLSHDLTKGRGKGASFSAGGGKYTLNGNQYTESLEYCNDRQWESNDFKFTVTIKGDTLTQQGIEKVDSLKVNRLNTEVYVRVR